MVSDDTALLVRFAQGERAAFLDVYAANARNVRRWVSRFFKSPFEQEEAAQEVWLMVHRMQSAFDLNRGGLGPWLRTVAANRCRELIRAKGRRPDASVPIEDVDDALWLDAPLPDERFMTATVKAAVEQFRKDLPKDEDTVLTQGIGDGLTHEELATSMGVTVRQSKYLKKKLVARLAKSETLRTLAKEWLS
jgi:RNA polymerase sigma-70 factor (ECF subfamily)